MSIFDSIISGAGEKFGLGNKSGALLAALLGLMTNRERGGFAGFLDLFRNAGLGDAVDSWITTGENTPLSGEQVESALGEGTIRELADQAGTDTANTSSALGYLIPNTVDRLTPDGEIPDETSLLSRIGGYLSGLGGAVGLGAAGAAFGGAFDRVDAAAETAGERVSSYTRADGEVADGDSGGSMLSWLLPLIILGLLVALGAAFCRKAEAPVVTNTANANANRTNTNATNTTNTNAANTNVAKANTANTNAATENRKLTEVSLPDGTKLQAYPGGIEDQLIKFIQSDTYKNATDEDLKKPENWFNFDDLNFKYNSPELEPSSKRQLDNIVSILKAFPNVKIKIGAYSDKKGDDAYNKKLSTDRAKSVKATLDKSGVGAQVPEAEGYGEELAKVPETASDQERAVDRRTAVRLLK